MVAASKTDIRPDCISFGQIRVSHTISKLFADP